MRYHEVEVNFKVIDFFKPPLLGGGGGTKPPTLTKGTLDYRYMCQSVFDSSRNVQKIRWGEGISMGKVPCINKHVQVDFFPFLLRVTKIKNRCPLQIWMYKHTGLC